MMPYAQNRDEAQTHTWWIDAICINQASLPERSSQVAMMRSIYSTAFQTLIYLGPSTPLSSTAMFLFPKIYTTIDQSHLQEPDLSRPFKRLQEPSIDQDISRRAQRARSSNGAMTG
jgi:hypothetical protein